MQGCFGGLVSGKTMLNILNCGFKLYSLYSISTANFVQIGKKLVKLMFWVYLGGNHGVKKNVPPCQYFFWCFLDLNF